MGKFAAYFTTTTSKDIIKTETYKKDYTTFVPCFIWIVDEKTASAIDFSKDELILGIKACEQKSFFLQYVQLYTCASAKIDTGSQTNTSSQTNKGSKTDTGSKTDIGSKTHTGGNQSGGNNYSGKYSQQVNKQIGFNSLQDKQIKFSWSSFNIPSSAKISKVVLNISTTKVKIGQWNGVFMSSTSSQDLDGEDYSGESISENISGKSAQITWNVAQPDMVNKSGDLKWTVYWIECQSFTIDSIDVYAS